MRYIILQPYAYNGRVYKPGDAFTDLPDEKKLARLVENRVITRESESAAQTQPAVESAEPVKKEKKGIPLDRFKISKGEEGYRSMSNTTSKVFEDWFCKFLLPETLTGDVIIMDNADFHNKKRLREYTRIYKVTIMFPPPYSPDYNPIENVWVNLKRFLRNSVVQLNSLVSSSTSILTWVFLGLLIISRYQSPHTEFAVTDSSPNQRRT